MPTYDYRCDECGHQFEHFQSMSSDKLVICPQCGAPRLRRLIGGGAGVIFKGGGFYETDYKRKPAGSVIDPSAGEETPAKSKSTGSSTDGATKSSSGGDGGKSESSGSAAPKSSD